MLKIAQKLIWGETWPNLFLWHLDLNHVMWPTPPLPAFVSSSQGVKHIYEFAFELALSKHIYSIPSPSPWVKIQIMSGKEVYRQNIAVHRKQKVFWHHPSLLTLFLPTKGWINPYTVITWHSPVGIGLSG